MSKRKKRMGFFEIWRKINNILDAFDIAKDIVFYVRKTANTIKHDPELYELIKKLESEIDEIAAK